ncbi:MAG TPA: OB-fold nucleic acid binding domain-containing protein, partial [Solirubrobacterales bacterium]|nr:OB-fold nucleic acid binding domain-containing protein [Solirubrobacterales bacterium]
KETLGTYLSSHPLSEVREALRARVDCSLTALETKQDGSWVTVGGIVTTCKKIRTKSGSQMMFATLDDVEGQVEMLVFKADQSESAEIIQPDSIVLVRGRIDHKDRGETKLVVQEAQRFEPDQAEIASAAKLAPAAKPAGPFEVPIALSRWNETLCDELKAIFEHHKGDAEVFLVVGDRRFKVGEKYRVKPSGGLQTELDHLLAAHALAA